MSNTESILPSVEEFIKKFVALDKEEIPVVDTQSLMKAYGEEVKRLVLEEAALFICNDVMKDDNEQGEILHVRGMVKGFNPNPIIGLKDSERLKVI